MREAPAPSAPTKAAPKAATAAKAAKKAAPAVADGAPRAADVSFDKPAAQKREGKVIKKAPSKPKSERDADAAKAKEAARVAAREKAAVCDLCGNQISVASRTCSMGASTPSTRRRTPELHVFDGVEVHEGLHTLTHWLIFPTGGRGRPGS